MDAVVERRSRQRHRRRDRERELVDCTRALFDERGLQDAPMDEIARMVKINRALIYRYFESKEELFVLTMTQYLDEIAARGIARVEKSAPADVQLRASWNNFCSYCLEYPAFLDCALSLMRRPAAELRASLTDTTWFRLGRSMSNCLAITIDILREGARDGVFTVEDAPFTTNCLYTQTIGMMHMARLGVGVSQSVHDIPEVFPIAPEQVQEACVRAALAAVGLHPQ
jgi:AcrR family transcriptional regulator